MISAKSARKRSADAMAELGSPAGEARAREAGLARMPLPRPAPAMEAPKGRPEPDQSDRDDGGPSGPAPSEATIQRQGVRTTLSKGGSKQSRGNMQPAGGDGGASEIPLMSQVDPGGSPSVVSGGGNTCTPSSSSAVLDWDVVEDGDNWRVSVNSLTLAGTIHITAWPSNPSTMTVPNTPNPVDGGNINNTAGSDNKWDAAIADLSNYDSPGGGAGPHWHDAAASRAHEWAHWNDDYVGDCVVSGDGGNWPSINRQMDDLRVSKAISEAADWLSPAFGAAGMLANAALNQRNREDARAELEPQVNALLSQWRRAAVRKWNSVIKPADVPGGGGRGYAAGVAVLNGHIGAIRAYKDSKGW